MQRASRTPGCRVVTALAVAVVVVLGVLGWVAGPAGAQSVGGGGGEPVVVWSGHVTVGQDETASSVFVVDGSARVVGAVTGDVVVLRGAVEVAGEVGGTVLALDGPVALGPGARVGGDLLSRQAPVREATATVAGTVTSPTLLFSPGRVVLGPVRWWLAVTLAAVAAGLALVGLVGRTSVGTLAEAGRARPFSALGVGLAALVALLAGAWLLARAPGGVAGPLAVAAAVVAAVVVVAGYAVAAVVVGAVVVRDPGRGFVAVLVGLAVLRVVAWVPVAGLVVGLLAACAGAGTAARVLWRAGRRAPAEEPVSTDAAEHAASPSGGGLPPVPQPAGGVAGGSAPLPAATPVPAVAAGVGVTVLAGSPPPAGASPAPAVVPPDTPWPGALPSPSAPAVPAAPSPLVVSPPAVGAPVAAPSPAPAPVPSPAAHPSPTPGPGGVPAPAVPGAPPGAWTPPPSPFVSTGGVAPGAGVTPSGAAPSPVPGGPQPGPAPWPGTPGQTVPPRAGSPTAGPGPGTTGAPGPPAGSGGGGGTTGVDTPAGQDGQPGDGPPR